MAYKSCENCGERVYNGLCVNCHESNFIEEQYHELNEPVPESIFNQSRKNEREVAENPCEYKSNRRNL